MNINLIQQLSTEIVVLLRNRNRPMPSEELLSDFLVEVENVLSDKNVDHAAYKRVTSLLLLILQKAIAIQKDYKDKRDPNKLINRIVGKFKDFFPV